MTSLSVIPPADQQRWNELYKLAPLIIILLYMRTRGERPITQSEIAENFQIARNTAANALRKLSLMGAVVQVDHNRGYSLSNGGRQMLLELDDPGCSKFEHLSLKESFKKDSKDLKDKKERKKQMLKKCSSERILSETGKLFPGHEVIHFGLRENLEPDYIFAWLAQAYDQHRQGKISHPWALVYRRLQTGINLPDRKYQDDPFQFLPNEFLVALDLAEPEVIEAEADDIEVTHVTEIVSAVEAEIYDAWMEVQEQLRVDLRKVEFETWVMGSFPVQFKDKLLSVAVRNKYAADWLKSRLSSTVQRLLVGMLNESDVRVEFVVALEKDESL